eukprot:TRINITY_DN972_c0_g1_i1.p1 TRINITY_DN972_c0_g1~~TRINITY_DN972_c0_g1_i1.p1  ORF type:complete len:302 (-),score=101.29 TRINITY_DN972_c0_g1_i1:101-1006(-)
MEGTAVHPYHKGKKVEDFYEMGEIIGRGSFSVVRKARNKSTKKFYAIKIIQKKMVRTEVLEREISIMQKLDHPHVLSMNEVFEEERTISIVLDLITGGELFEKVVERGHFSEVDASAIVSQIVGAVAYLHSQGVVHRDLKPENLLCTTETSKVNIFVSDFGLSRIFSDGDFEQMSTQCGSLEYCAPEVLLGNPYDQSVDMWSIGVITYILLTGYFPFFDPDRNPSVLFEKIQNVQYDWDDCPEVSVAGKSFVSELLVYDPKKRMTAKDALKHPWLKGDKLSSDNLNKAFANMLKNIIKKKK